jgi:polysaccharide export outer membrane protein
VTSPFNPPVYAYAAQGEVSTVSSQQLRTYLVSKDGYINFPVLGKVKTAGLSKQELSADLQEKIKPYLKDPLVNVQIVNFKVTMMGEVSRPEAISVKNDRLSILDAIGQVGDLTINANRKNVLVIRDNNGQKEFGRLDMTDPAIFTSPYYYLRQNDVVYVEPNEAKKKNARYSQAEQYSITVFTSILSAISVITTVVLAITK